MTLPDSRNAISLPESEAGLSRCDSPDGQTLDLFGLDRVHASRSAEPESAKVLPMIATSGRCSQNSLASANLQQYLENRLRAAMAESGSMLYALTWKRWDMQSGPPIFALRASARRTSDSVCIGWPTPITNDAKGSTHCNDRNGNPLLKQPGAVRLASWVTPSSRDWKDSPGMSQTGTNPDGSERARLDQLPRQVSLVDSGGMPTGSTAVTKNTGQLNPEHSRWLMGFPAAWGCCAATVTPSSRKSRSNS